MKKAMLFCSILGACAPHREMLVQQSLHDEGAQKNAEGLVARVEPITWENWQSEKTIVARLAWKEINMNAPIPMGGGSGAGGVATNVAHDERGRVLNLPMITVFADASLVPLPTFRVGLANTGDSAIDLAQARLYLEDGRKNRFAALPDAASVQGRVETWIVAEHHQIEAEYNSGILDAVRRAVASLPLWSARLKLAAGARWIGYTAFDLPVHDRDELDRFLAQAGKLKWVLEGAVREDGSAVAPLEFEFVASPQEVAVMCPPMVRHASWASCKQ